MQRTSSDKYAKVWQNWRWQPKDYRFHKKIALMVYIKCKSVGWSVSDTKFIVAVVSQGSDGHPEDWLEPQGENGMESFRVTDYMDTQQAGEHLGHQLLHLECTSKV